MWYLDDIKDMYTKYGIPFPEKPRMMSKEDAMKRVEFIQEELNELKLAIGDNDAHEVLDALVDIAVVTMGTAVLYGMSSIYDEAWDRVYKSNMKKEVITAEESKRGMKYDLRKPAGWKAPDFKDLLEEVRDGE